MRIYHTLQENYSSARSKERLHQNMLVNMTLLSPMVVFLFLYLASNKDLRRVTFMGINLDNRMTLMPV